MSLYTIGDPHLSFSCDKPMDIFEGWKDYVERLTQNWNSIVTENDTVVIVGDISWGMNLEEAKADFEYINDRLNGEKIILKGNHDYWFSTKKKCDDFFETNGFSKVKMLFNNSFIYGDYAICGTRGWINEPDEAVDKKVLLREANRLDMSCANGAKSGKEIIAFLHYPPVYYTDECKEIIEVLNRYNIKKCFYGHIHGGGSRYAIDGVYDGIDYRLVSCDYVNFTPVLVL